MDLSRVRTRIYSVSGTGIHCTGKRREEKLKASNDTRETENEERIIPFLAAWRRTCQILSEYMDKIAESGMKGVCIEARPHPDFVGDQWWSDLDLILAKAKENEMKVWILDDSHFPTGYANGKVKECYPQYLKNILLCAVMMCRDRCVGCVSI